MEQDLDKDARINKEIKRLKQIFKNLDKNKMAVVQALIENAAFYRIALQDLSEDLKEKGYIEVYQNGEFQHGTKKRPEADLHVAMSKNLSAIIKQLTELVPPEERKKSRLEALNDG